MAHKDRSQRKSENAQQNTNKIIMEKNKQHKRTRSHASASKQVQQQQEFTTKNTNRQKVVSKLEKATKVNYNDYTNQKENVDGTDETLKPSRKKFKQQNQLLPLTKQRQQNASESKPDVDGPKNSDTIGRPFSEFDLRPQLIRALQSCGITSLFPVQALTYNAIMSGKDVLVQARTGSGKTLAFGIPIIEKLYQLSGHLLRGRGPSAVIFCPTRQLAIQVQDVLCKISGSLVVTALYGGVAYANQERILRSGVDIVVATPGRAKDLLEKGTLHFDRISMVCLDEADHMLDIGFKDDIQLLLSKIAEQNNSASKTQPSHQTLLFSATVPDWVHTCKFISKTKQFIDMVGKEATRTASTIKFYRRKCQFSEISSMLADLIKVYSGAHGRTLVFTNTKKDCHDLSINNVKLDSQSLHGDMQQEQRESTMKSFRDNKFSVLIATDVAARGLDLPLVDLVIQCAPPSDIDAFIHRAGRTGRAGRPGVCVLLYQPREQYIVDRIERHAKIKFQLLPAPTRQQILRAVARDASEDLARVERRATNLFMDQAAELLKDADPVELVASALAVMSGYTTNITSRGLLTGTQGCVTLQLNSERPLPIPVYCSILRNNLGDDLFMRCRDITLLQDEPGCVFDVLQQFADHVLQSNIRGMEVKKIEVLPPIITRDLNTQQRNGGGGGNYGRGRSSSGFGRNSNYSNRRGGSFRGSSNNRFNNNINNGSNNNNNNQSFNRTNNYNSNNRAGNARANGQTHRRY